MDNNQYLNRQQYQMVLSMSLITASSCYIRSLLIQTEDATQPSEHFCNYQLGKERLEEEVGNLDIVAYSNLSELDIRFYVKRLADI
jgi:hypothetical protein